MLLVRRLHIRNADHPHSRVDRRFDPHRRILEHEALARIDAEAGCGEEEDLGVGLAAGDVLGESARREKVDESVLLENAHRSGPLRRGGDSDPVPARLEVIQQFAGSGLEGNALGAEGGFVGVDPPGDLLAGQGELEVGDESPGDRGNGSARVTGRIIVAGEGVSVIGEDLRVDAVEKRLGVHQ